MSNETRLHGTHHFFGINVPLVIGTIVEIKSLRAWHFGKNGVKPKIFYGRRRNLARVERQTFGIALTDRDAHLPSAKTRHELKKGGQLLSALRDPKIFRLWIGQALSSIGDEIYRVGLTWLAVGLIGADTGYLSAAQAASLMLLSFVGGKWADHWDALQTMFRIDLVRALIVLIPVAYSFVAPVPLWLLVVVAVVLSGLGAFFDPALQTALPRFLTDAPRLRTATGLMSTTTRLARMVGPALVGYLAGVFPPIHFFTMDAVSFAVSAVSVRSAQHIEDGARASPTVRLPKRPRISFAEAIVSGFRVLRTRPGMSFVLFGKCLTGGAWNLAYALGLAMLMQELAPHDTRRFGMVVASYGLGNFLGAVYFGNQRRRRSGLMMFSGFIWLGSGFMLVAVAPEISYVMAACAFAGFSGPMNELTFSDLLQARFPIADIARVFRLRMAAETAVTLTFMLMAPWLFRVLPVRTVIALCSGVWLAVGGVGLIWHQKKLDAGS